MIKALCVCLYTCVFPSCCAVMRSPAGWTVWPTSAPVSPSSRAACPRSGWHRLPSRVTSAWASTRMSLPSPATKTPPRPLGPREVLPGPLTAAVTPESDSGQTTQLKHWTLLFPFGASCAPRRPGWPTNLTSLQRWREYNREKQREGEEGDIERRGPALKTEPAGITNDTQFISSATIPPFLEIVSFFHPFRGTSLSAKPFFNCSSFMGQKDPSSF